jgi:hypothetical protein
VALVVEEGHIIYSEIIKLFENQGMRNEVKRIAEIKVDRTNMTLEAK